METLILKKAGWVKAQPWTVSMVQAHDTRVAYAYHIVHVSRFFSGIISDSGVGDPWGFWSLCGLGLAFWQKTFGVYMPMRLELYSTFSCIHMHIGRVREDRAAALLYMFRSE